MRSIQIKDLKDTDQVEKLCMESQEPVFITKNGHGRLVVMDIDVYERNLRQMYEAKAVMEGLFDILEGRVEDGEMVMKELASKILR